MGLWDASDAVRRAVPGSVKAMDIYRNAGPVFTESWTQEGGTVYHVCRVELYEREADGAEDGLLEARVVSEKPFLGEEEARTEYERLEGAMPKRPKERPPGDATPEERAEWEADRLGAWEDIERLGRLIDGNPGVPLEELVDVGPEERP